MRCAYKLRAYPTRPQGGRAVRLLADHCDLYNAALAERREAWRMRSISVRYGDQSAQLKEIRAGDPDGRGRHSFTAQQSTLRRLNVAFAAYFRRVRAAGKEWRVGYPRFKPYQRLKSLQLKREGRRWYVVVVTETETVPLPTTGRAIGVDVGVARFLTTSDGEMVANPRALAKAWRKVRNRRRDFHHKTARGLVDSCDTIALEDLRVAAMTASAAGTVGRPGRQDTVVCPVHGELDADLNGARNIATRAGLGSGQASAA